MIKRIFVTLFLTTLLLMESVAIAGSGLLFNVVATGTPANVNVTLCLNGLGPLSCQNYTVSALTLTISPTIPNHVYPVIGIKINTPGYAFSTFGLDCKSGAVGYCLFSASQNQAKTVSIVTQTTQAPQATLAASATPSSIVDGETAALSTTGGSGTGVVTYAVISGSSNCSISGSTLTGTSVGSCAVTATKAADANYSATTSSPITVTVTVAMPVVSVGFDNNHAPLSYTSTNSGVAWALSTTQPPVDGSGAGILHGVACSGDGATCTTVGFDNNTVPLSYTSTNSGVAWALSTTQPPVNGTGGGYLNGVACSSDGATCTAIGSDSSTAPLSYTSTNGGVAWALSTTQPPVNSSGGGYLNGVACSGDGATCTAVGFDNNTVPLSYTSTNSGVAWALSTTQPPVNSSGGGSLYGVVCSSDGAICTAVGFDNNDAPLSYTSTNGGIDWALSTTQPPDNGSGTGHLFGVACSSDGAICTAVGFDLTNTPLSYTSTNSGVTWALSTTQPPDNGTGGGFLNDVVCSSDGTTCVAVGSDNNSAPLSYTSTNGGIAWALSTTQPPVNDSGGGALTGVA